MFMPSVVAAVMVVLVVLWFVVVLCVVFCVGFFRRRSVPVRRWGCWDVPRTMNAAKTPFKPLLQYTASR